MNRATEKVSTVKTVTIANGAALSNAFYFGSTDQGMVLIPSAWTAANIGFQFSATESGTFTFLEHHDSGEPVQIGNIPTSTSVWKEFPPEVKAGMWVKLWSKSSTAATETDTNQGAARSLTVVLKS